MSLEHHEQLTTTRRVLAVLTMLVGAAVGAFLVLNTKVAWALGLALILLVAGFAAATRFPRMIDGVTPA